MGIEIQPITQKFDRGLNSTVGELHAEFWS